MNSWCCWHHACTLHILWPGSDCSSVGYGRTTTWLPPIGSTTTSIDEGGPSAVSSRQQTPTRMAPLVAPVVFAGTSTHVVIMVQPLLLHHRSSLLLHRHHRLHRTRLHCARLHSSTTSSSPSPSVRASVVPVTKADPEGW